MQTPLWTSFITIACHFPSVPLTCSVHVYVNEPAFRWMDTIGSAESCDKTVPPANCYIQPPLPLVWKSIRETLRGHTEPRDV